MLSKKYVVQKSFRIDAKLEHDLEILSNELQRPQNELVNMALENLMQENRLWFSQEILVDEFENFLQNGLEHQSCDIGGVCVDLSVNDDCSTTLKFCEKDENGNVSDKDVFIYQSTVEDDQKVIERLRSIAISFLINRPDIIEPYLKERLNYR